MYSRVFASALAIGLIAAPASDAAAEIRCAAHELVSDALAQQYGEVRKGLGLQGETSLLELWASDDTGTWTILLTRPDGTTCILASGIHWQRIESAALPGDPA